MRSGMYDISSLFINLDYIFLEFKITNGKKRVRDIEREEKIVKIPNFNLTTKKSN